MRLTVSLSLLGTLMLTHCASHPAAGTGGTGGAGDGLLAPPPAGEGIQLAMTSTIEPGQEIERCQLVLAPKGGLHVRKDEVRFTAGSHHVLLYKTPYATIPTRNEHGEAVDAGHVHDCAMGATDAWSVTGVVAGSQSSNGNSILGTLPEGVALEIEEGTVLLMDTHYLNASAKAVEADARINLYTMSKAEVKVEAGILFFYDPFIRVPANGASTARMRCPIAEDISIARLQSHMHRRGVGFAAARTDGAGHPLQTIYESNTWESVPAKDFQPLLQVSAGQALDYHCDYHNTESHDVIQGFSTRDEMCMLIGPYFPRSAALENCLDQTGVPAATWIGGGEADGAATLACIAGAQSDADFDGCIVDSCAAVGDALSGFVRCQHGAQGGTCSAACGGMDQGGCQACLTQACGAQLGALSAATCD